MNISLKPNEEMKFLTFSNGDMTWLVTVSPHPRGGIVKFYKYYENRRNRFIADYFGYALREHGANPLRLHMDYPEWTISGEDMGKVLQLIGEA